MTRAYFPPRAGRESDALEYWLGNGGVQGYGSGLGQSADIMLKNYMNSQFYGEVCILSRTINRQSGKNDSTAEYII